MEIAPAREIEQERGWEWWATQLALVIVILLFGVPFLWMLAASFDADPKNAVPWPNDPTLANYTNLLRDGDIQRNIKNSVIVSVPGALLATLLAALAGYGLSRLRWKGKEAAVYSVLLLQALPIAVTMVAIYDLATRLDLIDKYLGLIIVNTAISLPFLTWLMKGFYDAVPRSLDEAAWVDGRSRLRAWWDVVLPTVKPGLAVCGGLAFAFAWSEVLLTSILITTADMATLPFTFFYATESRGDVEDIAALGVLYILPVVVLFLALRHVMGKGLVEGTRGL